MRRATLALALIPVLLFGPLLALAVLVGSQEPLPAGACGPVSPGVDVSLTWLRAGPVAGYSGQQLTNAALVMNAGKALGLDVRAQTIGVMTAMGESSLVVVDHGDAAGPDSRGLFQQRANGAWGSYADRMDPTTSATNFFRALQQVEGWQTLSPTLAAHRTQRNADPYHYQRFWDPAVQVVTALAGVTVTGIAEGTGGLACTGQAPTAPVGASAWTRPAIGAFTSGYGPRWGRAHNGVDIAPPCGAPIHAAAGGVVVRAGPAGGYGNLIVVDHGEGVVTRYAHMYNEDVLVAVGQTVAAGQQIARVGSFGDSTGCHLHFEVQHRGGFTDPEQFLAGRGVPLR